MARDHYTCSYCDHDPDIFPGDRYVREVWVWEDPENKSSVVEVRHRHRDMCPEDPRDDDYYAEREQSESEVA